MTLAEQVVSKKEEIEEAKAHLQKLQEELTSLEDQLLAEEKKLVMAAIDASNKSTDEIMAFLKGET